MRDYISREAAIQTAEHAYHEWNLAMAAADGQRQINRCFKMQELCKAVASVFEDAPAADVGPVRHGRWEGYTHSRFCGYDKDGDPIFRDGIVWYCSNLECRRKTVIKEKFCPNCGAKMDLEDGDCPVTHWMPLPEPPEAAETK